MDKMLAGLPFATAYLHDIVVVSGRQDDHRRHLHAVFDRINEYGFRVRPEKCSFLQPSIKHLGFIVDKDGRRPDHHCSSRHAGTHHHHTFLFPWASQLLPILRP